MLDDIDRLSNSNLMVENIIECLSHISYDHSMHLDLMTHGYVEVINKYVSLLTGLDETDMSLAFLSTGCVNLAKAIVQTILNISENTS